MVVKSKGVRVIRRSFALPKALIEEASSLAPEQVRGNANRIVRAALEEFVARRREERIQASLAQMASDPQIVNLSRRLFEEFRPTESDGLKQ